MSDEQCCGNCEYWRVTAEKGNTYRGRCTWLMRKKVPIWILKREEVRGSNGGTECLVWRLKDGE